MKKIVHVALMTIAIILLINPSAKATLFWESDIGTVSLMADDDFGVISLGFNVNFYGVSYSSIRINSNGSITFGDGNYDPFNVSFPAAEDVVGGDVPGDEMTMAAPLWDDLTTDPTNTGRSGTGLYTNILGSPGERRFVATWNDVGHYNLQPRKAYPNEYYGSDTFQIVLFEYSNSILFSYLNLDGVKSPYHASPRDVNGITIGVNAGDISGTIRGTQYLYGFVPTASLPEYESLLFTWDPNYHGPGIGGYSVGIATELPPPPPTSTPVPEPSTSLLTGIGIIAGILIRFYK